MEIMEIMEIINWSRSIYDHLRSKKSNHLEDPDLTKRGTISKLQRSKRIHLVSALHLWLPLYCGPGIRALVNRAGPPWQDEIAQI